MKKSISRIYLALVFLFLYAPIGVMIVLSFNSSHVGVSNWEGFTFSNYLSLFQNEELVDALINSLIIALLSALTACILGTLGALGLNNVKKARGLLMNFSNLPIINPEIVTGVSLMLVFISVFSLKLGFFTVLLSHIVFNTPYVILNVMPRIRRMDKNLYEAALDLGCPPAKAFFRVVLPEIFPGIFAGFLISLTYSFDDFIISYFTGGNFQTLSVFINNSMKKGIQSWMTAMTGVIFVAVLLILVVMNIHDARAEAREKNPAYAPSPKKGRTALKLACGALALVLILGLCLPRMFRSNDENTLVVCNWGEYMSTGDPEYVDVIEEFEKQTGIRVEYVTAESNEALYAKMKSGSGLYDVIFPSDYMAERMISEGMLKELNWENIPNYENIMDDFKGAPYDPEEKYTVPYFWGTVGIIYNESMLTEEDLKLVEDCKDWSILWSDNYPNQVMMFDNPRDAFGIALKQLGYSQNTTDTKELQEAAELLQEQKFIYAMDQFFELMPSGSLAVGAYYAGDCMAVMEENEDLRFVIPECGTNLFRDAMCIPATSQKQEMAEKFINFMLTAEAGKANTEYVYYSTPNQAVFDVLDPEMQENEVAYPERKETWESFRYLPPKVNDLMTELWNTVKTNNK